MISTLFLAIPTIDYLEIRKTFYWCIMYKITGVPPPNRTWYFNSKPLETSENIEDLESVWSSKNIFLIEGMKLIYLLKLYFFLLFTYSIFILMPSFNHL